MYRLFPAKCLSQWLLAPASCGLCQESDSNGLLCPVCRSLLAPNTNPCVLCAEPVPHTPTDPKEPVGNPFSEHCNELRHTRQTARPGPIVCRHCADFPPSYRSAIVPYLFSFPVDFMVHELKYRNSLVFGRLLGSLLGEYLLRNHEDLISRIDYLVAVPLSVERIRTRGFNQSREMAHWCAKVCGLEVCDSFVQRRHTARTQTGLGRLARLDNLHDVFKASNRVAGSQILLIDDVMSTGATLDSLASTLTEAGATSVDVCAFARTPSSGLA